MNWWQRVQYRSGWSEQKHGTRVWIVWFLILVAIGLVFELTIEDLPWAVLIAVAMVTRFMAKYIIGPKEDDDD